MASGASLYTHYVAVPVLAALNIAFLISLVRAGSAGRCLLGELLGANLLVTALYGPWLPVLAQQAFPSGASSPAKTVPATALLQRLWKMAGNPFPFGGMPWIDIRFLPLILLGTWRFRHSRDVAFLFAFVLCGLVSMFLASQFRPMLDGKTLAWAGLFALLAASAGCAAFGRFRLPILVLMVVLQLRSSTIALRPAPEGWSEAAGIMRQMARPQDTVFLNYAGAVLPLRRYGWPEPEMNIAVFAKGNEEPWFRGRAFPIVTPQEAIRQATLAGRVWLLTYGGAPRSGGIAKEIETKSIRLLHCRTEKLDLSLFVPNTP